jgi:hypothetical protein
MSNALESRNKALVLESRSGLPMFGDRFIK